MPEDPKDKDEKDELSEEELQKLAGGGPIAYLGGNGPIISPS